MVYVLSNPRYTSAACVDKVGHTCAVYTFWNSDPKQTPEPIHAALRWIIDKYKLEFRTRGHDMEEVVIFSDRCGEQFAGRKNFRSCSESAMELKVWIMHEELRVCTSFCRRLGRLGRPGSEARILKKVEIKGDETFRTVIDIVLYLRRYREKLEADNNQNVNHPCHVSAAESTTDTDDSGTGQQPVKQRANFKVDVVHVMLLQLCECRNICRCQPDPRVITDTIFYKRDGRYEAEVIKGCSSIYSYRFDPRRPYVVYLREYMCQSCPECTWRPNGRRSWKCHHLDTVRCTSYKGRGVTSKLQSDQYIQTGWIPHTIVPLTLATPSVTRAATDGVLRIGRECRKQYMQTKKPGDIITMCNLADCNNKTEVDRTDFWLARLLPRDNKSDCILWKTNKSLPPDVKAGSWCCKIEWLERKDLQCHPRKFNNGSMQFIELNCSIVPLKFKITFDRVLTNCQWLNSRVEQQLLSAVQSCVVLGELEE